MKPETTSSNPQLFRSSRRWSPIPFIVSGVLLVAGYVGRERRADRQLLESQHRPGGRTEGLNGEREPRGETRRRRHEAQNPCPLLRP
jgi:hypothetical protein